MTISFYYKGLGPEDRIYEQTPTKSASLAKGTLYEAWFDVLQTSPWYKSIAETGDFPSDRAKNTWDFFGDLRDITFSKWWLKTGYRIFSEAVPFRSIENIEPSQIKLKLKQAKEDSDIPKLLLEVPLNLSPQALQDEFRRILKQHDEYYEQYDRWNYSTAQVHQQRETKHTYSSIKRVLTTYKECERLRATENLKLYDIAMRLNLNPTYINSLHNKNRLSSYEKEVLSNMVSDQVKPARYLMANATEMSFPNDSPHPWAVRKRNTPD